MTDEREAKLPKWARDELSLLRRRIAEKDTEIAELRGPVGGYIWSDWYERVPLPMSQWRRERPIVFFGGDRDDAYFQVKFDSRTYVLEIHGAGSRGPKTSDRSDALLVRPVASNVVEVRHASHSLR